MSSATTNARREFPWNIFRGPTALFGGFAMQADILRHVDKYQWWFPAGCVSVALVTVFFSGYDKDPGDGVLGDLTLNSITWLMVILGLPITALVCGVIGGSGLWIVGGLAVLVINSVLYFGFREPGLPGVLVLACLVVLAVAG